MQSLLPDAVGSPAPHANLPHGWVRAWTGLGACLVNRNAWKLGIQVLRGPTSLLESTPPPPHPPFWKPEEKDSWKL